MMALLKTFASAVYLFVAVNLPEEETSAWFDTLSTLLKHGSTVCAAAKAEKADIAIIKATTAQIALFVTFIRILFTSSPHTHI